MLNLDYPLYPFWESAFVYIWKLAGNADACNMNGRRIIESIGRLTLTWCTQIILLSRGGHLVLQAHCTDHQEVGLVFPRPGLGGVSQS